MRIFTLTLGRHQLCLESQCEPQCSCESPHAWFYFPEDLTKFPSRIFLHRRDIYTPGNSVQASSEQFLIFNL